MKEYCYAVTVRHYVTFTDEDMELLHETDPEQFALGAWGGEYENDCEGTNVEEFEVVEIED